MKLLQAHQITKHPSYDLFGYVFTYEDRLYRAIYPSHEAEVLRVFDSGLIDELIQNRLFPKSEVTDFHTSDCNLVIHHEKIPVVTLPFEWSFSMLKGQQRSSGQTPVISASSATGQLQVVRLSNGRPT